MTKKTGFTLVELLAVIVILSVILLITVPILKSTIRDSKVKTRIQSIELFLRNFENIITDIQLEDENLSNYCIVTNGSVMCGDNVIFVEKNMINGSIYYNSDEIVYYDLNLDGYYFSQGATTDECFSYTTSNNEVAITGYYDYVNNDSNNDACPKDVIIPERISGMNVTSIENYAFRNKSLTSVIIPSHVTDIGTEVFYKNRITYAIIGNSVVNIGNEAFGTNLLTDIVIPDSVVYLGMHAFYDNVLENVTIGNNVRVIEQQAFYCNSLTTVDIPDSVETIGIYAFKANELSSVSIGSGVSEILSSAFGNNSCDSGSRRTRGNTNKISSMVINAHANDVTVANDAFSGVVGEVCWLKDTPTCGS